MWGGQIARDKLGIWQQLQLTDKCKHCATADPPCRLASLAGLAAVEEGFHCLTARSCCRLEEHLPLSRHAKEKVKAAQHVLHSLKAKETNPDSRQAINEQLSTLETLRHKDHQARHLERKHRHELEHQRRTQTRQQLDEPTRKLGDNLFGFPCFDKKPEITAVGETPRPEYEVWRQRHITPQP